MEAGDRIIIRKTYAWSRGVRLETEAGAHVGFLYMKNRLFARQAVSEAGGKTLTLIRSPRKVRSARIENEWGHAVGTIERDLWCDTGAHIMLYEKEYAWKTHRLGTFFEVGEGNGAAIARVCGTAGFWTRGEVELYQSLNNAEALALINIGLFEMRRYELEVAIATAGIVSPLIILLS